MKLNFKVFGEGEPLVILHGLMGMLDNWQGPTKEYSKNFRTYILDARNHGRSGHSMDFNYQVMMEDLLEFVEAEQLDNFYLMGHSMGGKTAMKFAQNYPEYISKLIVADIGPKGYPLHHQAILSGLSSLNFANLKSRGEVDEVLKPHIPDMGTRAFLMKSIYWKEKGVLDLRFNLEAIIENIVLIGEAVQDRICERETLFIRGANSNYVLDKDWNEIRLGFPQAHLETIQGAGHWLHAEKPEEFVSKTTAFLQK